MVRRESGPNSQLILIPSQRDLETQLYGLADDRQVLDLLNELGGRGWQLVGVDGEGRYWLKRREPAPEPKSGEPWAFRE